MKQSHSFQRVLAFSALLTTSNGFQLMTQNSKFSSKCFDVTNHNKLQRNLECNLFPSNNKNQGDMNDDERLRSTKMSEMFPDTTFGAEDVPDAQVPANEYLDLMRQPLFDWATDEKGSSGLAIRLGIVYAAFFWLISFPIAGATFTQEGFLLQKLASANVASLLVLLILIIRLYSGWGYIGARLRSNIIEYEETGWYDGQIATKSEKEKARDLFLYRSDVQPAEDRIKAFAGGVAALWIISCVGLNVALKEKPLFNEYDPELLERLVYDEKAAGVAAQQSNGRPTYCNSRYYKAVANGGQGC